MPRNRKATTAKDKAAKKALTTIEVRNLRPRAERYEVPDPGGKGLYVVVQPSGAKSFAFRYHNAAGQAPKLTLGSWHDGPELDTKPVIDGPLTLAGARLLAAEALHQVKQGRDPAAEKRTAKQATKQTAVLAARDDVFAVIDDFVERYAKVNIRNWQARERLLKTHLAPWKDRTVQSITKRDVLDVLDGIVKRGRPVMANRVLAHTRKFFNWSIERGILGDDASGRPRVSPCAGVKAPAKEKSRERFLDDRELRTVLLAARSLGWPFGAQVELMVLTGCRLREAADMTWGEVKFDERTWRIPGARTKTGNPHDVPLSDRALALLKGTPRIAGKASYVFTLTGDRPIAGFSWWKEKLDKACTEPVEKWTLHDTRRVVASGMAKLGIYLPVVEKVLGHTSGSFAGIVGTYQKHQFTEERRDALQRWADHVEELISGEPRVSHG
jgi:integrase